MRMEMKYLNEKTHEMETVDVLGFAPDTTDYCECYTESRGHFIAPVKNLYSIRKKKSDKPVGHIFTHEDGFVVKDDTGTVIKTYSPYDAIRKMSENADVKNIIDRILNDND